MLLSQLSKRTSLLAFVILSLTIGTAIGTSIDYQKCKTEVRRIIMDHCSSGNRDKRSSLAVEDFARTTTDTHRMKKRQIMSIREIIQASRIPIRDDSYQAVPPTLWTEQRSNEAPLPVLVVPPVRRRIELLPEESGSHIGFDINSEELFELYDEIYGRSPRQAVHWECCKNVELCRNDKKTLNNLCSKS